MHRINIYNTVNMDFPIEGDLRMNNYVFLARDLRIVAIDEVQTSLTFPLNAGRLEIYIGNQWGTVCSDGFDIADAGVACRQLGFEGAIAYSDASSLG